jgi:molecular chaperone DnaK (HSP70)
LFCWLAAGWPLQKARALLLTAYPSHRRLIGRRFDDPTVKKDIESWPFKIVDDNGQPKIEVDYLGEKKQFSAQEISSMVLLKVRIPATTRSPARDASNSNCQNSDH